MQMSKKTSAILSDHFYDFVNSEIEAGRYSSVSEVIRSGLRLLEDESEKIEAINEALVLGEKSGEVLKFDNDEFKARMRNRLWK